MSTTFEWFLATWLVGLMLWIATYLLHRKALLHYQGPTGPELARQPYSRYYPSNYTPAGATIVRLECLCAGAFVIVCVIGMALARSFFSSHH